MNTDTKRHIDSARQVLVGVVPNPTSQIDQITNALIYKFMDDMDQAAIKQGDKPSFFIDDLEQYSWTSLMDSRIGNQERMNLYSEALIKFSQAKQLPELFRDIFKSAFLPYRSPEVLGMFLKEIAYFDYSHPEELGNAYEYLLSIMSSQGDAGQFRTPRHIIDFIVNAVNPTKDDKVLDPACGTGGFLVSSYKHILKQHDGKDDPNQKEKPLTPDERKKLMGNFVGYDVDPGMQRIAQVNMYLHQFKSPKIYQYNTLSSEERWSDKFDVILANPPFMSPKGGIKPHSKFSIASNRSEVLFVDYIMNHLRPKGRAGIIVPEGIIFQSGKAYKQLRKNLLNDGLFAVVSLPSGVFNPYAGVKTSILLFDNEVAKSKDEILFVKIANDGYSLGAQRKKIEKDDLPEALLAIKSWREGKKADGNILSYVEKDRIADDSEYNLSVDRYRITTDFTNAKWPMVELGEVTEILNGYAFKSEKYTNKGIRIIRITNVQKGGIVDDDPKFISNETTKEIERFLLIKNDLLISLTGNVGRVGLLQADLLPAGLNQRVGCIRLKDYKKITIKYLFHLLNTDLFEGDCTGAASGVAQKNLSTEWLKKYQIPLPPLEIQEQIVKELDGYAGIIAGAKQIVENWKPKIDIDPEWEKVKLGDVLEKVSEQVDPQKHKGEVYYIGLENIESNSGRIVGEPISKYEEIKSLKNSFQSGDILYGKLRPNLNKVWLADREGICSTDILVFRETNNSLANFYWYLLLSDNFVSEVMTGIKGAQLPRVGFEHLRNLILPHPSIAIQEKFVEEIELEKELVESAKKLIGIYEGKTKDAVAKLWDE